MLLELLSEDPGSCGVFLSFFKCQAALKKITGAEPLLPKRKSKRVDTHNMIDNPKYDQVPSADVIFTAIQWFDFGLWASGAASGSGDMYRSKDEGMMWLHCAGVNMQGCEEGEGLAAICAISVFWGEDHVWYHMDAVDDVGLVQPGWKTVCNILWSAGRQAQRWSGLRGLSCRGGFQRGI